MQQISRRSNRDRSEATRATLLDTARTFFIEKGFAETSTPEITAAAGVTRGALYHHYADKRALFAAVVEREAEAVAGEIETMPLAATALETLLAASRIYLEAMTEPGRSRLLLIDGPAVLGLAEMDAIHARHGNRTLHAGLEAAMEEGMLKALPLDALTEMLGALFDRAALSIVQGASLDDTIQVINAVIAGLRPDAARTS